MGGLRTKRVCLRRAVHADDDLRQSREHRSVPGNYVYWAHYAYGLMTLDFGIAEGSRLQRNLCRDEVGCRNIE